MEESDKGILEVKNSEERWLLMMTRSRAWPCVGKAKERKRSLVLGAVIKELRGQGVEQIIFRDTKDVEDDGQKSGGGERAHTEGCGHQLVTNL